MIENFASSHGPAVVKFRNFSSISVKPSLKEILPVFSYSSEAQDIYVLKTHWTV